MATKPNGQLREFLLASRRREGTVEIMGRTITVRALTIGARDRIQSAVIAGRDWRPIALIDGLYHPDSDEPVFTSDDRDALAGLPSTEFEPAIDMLMKLTQFTPAEMSELEGN